jgi:hypothetical protein
MAFMERETLEDDCYVVDTIDGTYIVPLHVSGFVGDPETCDASELAEGLQPYVEGKIGKRTPVELHRGVWVGRLQAPGYLDSTDWIWAETEEELEAELTELYGEE